MSSAVLRVLCASAVNLALQCSEVSLGAVFITVNAGWPTLRSSVIYLALDRFSGKGPVTTPEGAVA